MVASFPDHLDLFFIQVIGIIISILTMIVIYMMGEKRNSK